MRRLIRRSKRKYYWFRYYNGYLIRWVGFYIDIDLVIYMMILNSEFVNSLFERISKFWFTKTFNRMDIYQIINGNNLTLRFFEIVYHHNGFLYYSYFPSLFKYNNESIFTNINNFLFMRIPNYCDWIRVTKSNIYGFIVNYDLDAWQAKYTRFNIYSCDYFFKNVFSNKYIVNISKNLLFINNYDKFIINIINFSLLRQYKNDAFFITAFWSFKYQYVIWESLKFHCLVNKEWQHKRLRILRVLVFYFQWLVKICHNLMVVYTNFFMLSRKYIVLNNWNSIKFNSILYNNEVSILGYNAVYISRFRFKHMLRKKLFFSSEHFFKPNDFNINFNLCNKLNVNYLDSIYNNNFLFKSVFENKGHLLNSSLGTDYGLSTLISISSYKKLYNPKFSIMSSYCWYQFKYDNYRRCTAMDFDLITDLALEDLIYFYKDLYDTESTFKLWKWYAYWNGIDFHVHWGWLGYYKLLKIKSLKRRVFLATWWWSLLQDLYLKLEQVIDLHTELGWLLDFWWINIDPNFRAPVWLWKYNLLLY